jgi:hypothetical protein
VFQEHNRGKIGIGILREKMGLEEMAEDSKSKVAYTSIVDDYEAEKNSQELFQYCLEQSTLE